MHTHSTIEVIRFFTLVFYFILETANECLAFPSQRRSSNKCEPLKASSSMLTMGGWLADGQVDDLHKPFVNDLSGGLEHFHASSLPISRTGINLGPLPKL